MIMSRCERTAHMGRTRTQSFLRRCQKCEHLTTHISEVLKRRMRLSTLHAGESRKRSKSNDGKRSGTIESFPTDEKTSEPHDSGNSTGIVPSSESNESPAHGLLEDIEFLKRKLSLHRNAGADAAEVRRERDHLRETADRNGRRVSQLKDIMRKSKDNERALKNTITSFEERLEAGNTMRLDILEGFDEASARLTILVQRERKLTQEVEDLRSRACACPAAQAQETEPSTPPDKDNFRNPRREGRLAAVGGEPGNGYQFYRHSRGVQCIIGEKDAHVRLLDAVKLQTIPPASGLSTPGNSLQSERIRELECELYKHKDIIARIESDCGRYNPRWYHDLRSNTRNRVPMNHRAIAQIDAEAHAFAIQRIAQLKAENENATAKRPTGTKDDNLQSESLAIALGRELEHCIKDIITGKLDAKAYQKDLRIAKARIVSLYAANGLLPPTPNSQARSGGRSNSTPDPPSRGRFGSTERCIAHATPSQSGLGIFTPETVNVPRKAVQYIGAPPRMVDISSLRTLALSSGSPAIHKELPKTPRHLSLTPVPFFAPCYGKTLESEAVHAVPDPKTNSSPTRSTATLENDVTITPCQCSTPLPRSKSSPTVPMSKFASRFSVDSLSPGQQI